MADVAGAWGPSTMIDTLLGHMWAWRAVPATRPALTCEQGRDRRGDEVGAGGGEW